MAARKVLPKGQVCRLGRRLPMAPSRIFWACSSTWSSATRPAMRSRTFGIDSSEARSSMSRSAKAAATVADGETMTTRLPGE